MDLHVTLAAGPGVQLPGGEPTEEIVINRAHLASGKQLHQQLFAHTGAEHLFIDGAPLADLEPGAPPLTSGAVIVATKSEHCPTRPARPSNLFFIVRSGPDAGKSVPLERGLYTIGRSAADITIHDPELSRMHALLTVTNEALTLHDRNAANGVWVDGCRVDRAAVTTDSDIRIGSSQCALVLLDTPAEPVLAVDLSEPCEVSAPPPPEGNRLLILTAFLPLVFGIVLAVVTGMWFFLAFSALSAVTGLVPLINGRRKGRAFETAVATAVATDSERRRRAAADAGELTLAALQPVMTAFGQPSTSHCGGKYVRIGTADQPANIEVKPPSSCWQPPVIAGVPTLIPLVEPGREEPLSVDICGPQQILSRVAHVLLLQLSTLHEAGEILCYGPASNLPPAARFLPRVTLVAHLTYFTELLATGRYSSILLFGAATVVEATGSRIYRFISSEEGGKGRWTVDYSQPDPVLKTPAGATCFRPDFVSADTFELVARAMGTRGDPGAVEAANTSVPETLALPDLIGCDSASITERWRAGSDGARLRAGIGSSAEGPVFLDLVTDGPHLLIAGTTGSGKSEFLRTLVLSLTLNYSPADLTFLFIDFKGGSGLGGLALLPHVTGMLTDLSTAAVSRALISLKAEVKRRESIFAGAGAADYPEYRERTRIQLPRLVIVIDEFRMLSEEVPGSVHELMRIATLGRSLGMHLVLATQRPQGAVTTDIRANITASVALRMQSAMESQDVLESAVAASIPVRLPGRGYLRIASGQPIQFQTATTAHVNDQPSASIRTFRSILTQDRCPDTSVHSACSSPGESLSQTADSSQVLVSAVNGAAQSFPLPPSRAPVRPPLPATVTRATAGDILQLGLLDIPEKQDQRLLTWDPPRHSHLAIVGQAGSGLGMILPSVIAEHLRTRPNGHLYLLDGDSSLRAVRDAPQVGAYVTAPEVKRAGRVLERLAELVTDRLNTAAGSAASAPDITVCVTGWGRWTTAFRSSRFAWAENALQDIVRDGEASGITLVIAGERELIASRFFSMLPNRMYLPLGASSEALLSWPKLPAVDSVPGRAVVQGRISPDGDAVAQLILDTGPRAATQPGQQPFCVAALPRVVSSTELRPASSTTSTVRIPVGVGGDDLGTIHLALPPRTAALVVGSAGMGKSQTLDLLAHLAPSTIKCVRPSRNEDPAAFWKRVATAETASDELLLVDDADLLPRDVHQQLAAMLAAGARVVFACPPSPSITTSPALASLRVNPVGIVLGPRSPTDGDVFGLRLEVDGTPPPGRGILFDSGRSVELQVAKWEVAVSGSDHHGHTG